MGVVIVDGEAFIKKVFFENDKARLQSFNKKYKDIIVDDSNDFRIIGKVVL
nr:S24 family peptidase [Enterococcus hirae]